MNKKYSLECRFTSRLEHTKSVFGYISLDAIVNGQLKQKIHINNMNLKRIDTVITIQRKRLPVPYAFKKNLK
ncbi:hypothetical protein C0W28_00915 [Photobacterium kishitanii]|nr:hypothetical protein C0W28_00915 [Photobacterium kishitanii]